MAGAAMNPQVNNGGAGTAGVSLRGLGSNRTLLLINGHRIPFQLQDLNLLPVSAVERIEVLNDGASAVYGSDAIAGVVNIITRTNYQGAEFGADYGISPIKDDGERKARSTSLFGQSTDKGNIVFGVQYDKQDPVSAANRKLSKRRAIHLQHGRQYACRFIAHAGWPLLPSEGSPIATQLGCTSVTLSGNKLPSLTTPPTAADFRCLQLGKRRVQLPGRRQLRPDPERAHRRVRARQLQADRQRRSLRGTAVSQDGRPSAARSVSVRFGQQQCGHSGRSVLQPVRRCVRQ